MSRIAEIVEIKEFYEEKLLDQSSFEDKVVENLIAADIMTPGVVMIPNKATVKDAVDLFLKEKVTALIVADHNDRPIGVFSETDLARFERERPNPVLDDMDREYLDTLNKGSFEGQQFHAETFVNESVSEWMTPHVIGVDVMDPLEKVCNTLVDNRIHRVFVTKNKRLVGVISSMDIVSAMAAVLDKSERL